MHGICTLLRFCRDIWSARISPVFLLLRQARLVPGWVTVFGRVNHLGADQVPTSTQPEPSLRGYAVWVPSKSCGSKQAHRVIHQPVSVVLQYRLVFLCPVTDISATVAPISVKFCMIDWWYTSVPDRSSPLLRMVPQGPQIRNFGPTFWLFDREYLENGKSQRYMSIRA